MKKERKVQTYWNEQWEKIETKAPTKKTDYYISNHGRVKRVNRENGSELLSKKSKSKTGYLRLIVSLVDGKLQDFYIHRLVGNYFVKRESEKHIFVIHQDGNKENNYQENLKWLTRQQLNNRWSDLGTYKKINPKNTSIKLTESKVILLKQRLKRGKTKKKILAKQFDISLTQLIRIERGENWSHIK